LKILIACSFNSGKVSPFVREQVQSLKGIGVECDYYKIIGKGINGYLKNIKPLRTQIRRNNYDLIHAHYGLSGLLANLQRKVPVITTYHGSDVYQRKNINYSKMAARLSCYNILVNEKLNRFLHLRDHFSVIPCGIDTENFKPMSRGYCKRQMGLSAHKNYILFSSSFNREEKNAGLAKKAVKQLQNTELIELKGYNRQEVNLLINAANLVLVTSFYETGPLIVKESLACNTPVVSTDVGDVKDLIADLDHCYITSDKAEDITKTIERVLNQGKNGSNSRNRLQNFELQKVAKRIKAVYDSVLA
jgi:glycosyltransferase involved in cell wall biosynthesis